MTFPEWLALQNREWEFVWESRYTKWVWTLTGRGPTGHVWSFGILEDRGTHWAFRGDGSWSEHIPIVHHPRCDVEEAKQWAESHVRVVDAIRRLRGGG